MAKETTIIPSQNNNIDIIKSSVKNMNDVINVIVKNVNKHKSLYTDETITSISSYSSVINTLFSSKGVINLLIDNSNKLNNFGKTKIDSDVVKKSMSNLIELYNYFIELLGSLNSSINTISVDLVKLRDAANAINAVSSIRFNVNNFDLLNIQAFLIRRNIRNTINILTDLSYLKIDSEVIDTVNKNLTSLKNAVKTVNELSFKNEVVFTRFSIIAMLSIKRNIRNIMFLMKKISKLKIDNAIITDVENNLGALKKAVRTIKDATNVDDLAKSINPMFALFRIRRNIGKTIKLINGISKIKIDNGLVKEVKTNLSPIKDVINEIRTIIDYIQNFKMPKKLGWKIFLIKRGIGKIAKMLSGKSFNNLMGLKLVATKILTEGLKSIITSLTDIFNTINEAKLNVKTLIKLQLLKFFIRRLIPVLDSVDEVAKKISMIKGIRDTASIIAIFAMLKGIFDIIHDTRLGIGMRRKIRKLNRRLSELSTVINHINMMGNSNERGALRSLAILNLIIANISLMLLLIIASVPIYIVGSVAIWVLVGCLVSFRFALTVIGLLFNKVVVKDIANTLKNVMLIIGVLTAVALMLYVLVLIAEPIIKSAMNILKLFGIIIAVVVALGLLAMLAKLIAPFVAVTFTVYGAILAVMGVIMLIAFALRALGEIELDRKAIITNVRMIIDTAFMVAFSIFNINTEKNDPEKNNSEKPSFWKRVGNALGHAVTGLFGIFFSVPFFAMTLTSVILIRMIAGCLNSLQKIVLEPDKITIVVKNVIDAAFEVINSIFYRDSEKDKINNDNVTTAKDKVETEKTGKGKLKDIAKTLIGGAVVFLEAFTSTVFLWQMFLSIFMIRMIAGTLRGLQKIELNRDKILENVEIVIAAALDVIKSIFNRKDEEKIKENTENANAQQNEEKKKGIMNVIKIIGGTILNVLEAIMSSFLLAYTFMSISFIHLMAKQLNKLSEIELNETAIDENIEKIILCAKNVTNAIFNRDTVKKEDKPTVGAELLYKLFDLVSSPFTVIVPMILTMAFLTSAVISMSLVRLLANQLNKIGEIELSENINIKIENIVGAAKAVSDAIFTKTDVITNAQGNQETVSKKKNFLQRMFSGFGSAIDLISSLGWISSALISVGLISDLATKLKTIIELPDTGKVAAKTAAIISSTDTLIKKMTEQPDIEVTNNSKNRLSVLDQINASVFKIANITPTQSKTIDRTLKDYSKFIDKINSVDLMKLETSTMLFGKMAEFSESIKGDFDMLASTLNEELMPILEELKEIMTAIPEKLDTGFQNTSASISAANAPATRENIEEQVKRENPNMSDEEIKKVVDARLAEQAKSKSESVASKLDDLMDLLKGRNGQLVVVDAR